MKLRVSFFWLLACLSSFSATIDTKTIKEDGTGNYTSLNQWEGLEQANLVTADRIAVASIEGVWTNADTTAVTISGWTTDATRYIVITNSTSKHDGKRYGSAANAYRLEVSGLGSMGIREEFTRVYGLQIKNIYESGTPYCLRIQLVGISSFYVGNCIFTADWTGTAGGYAFFSDDADITVYAFNNLAHNCVNGTATCRAFISNQGTNYWYNNTCRGNYVSFRKNGPTTVSNCLSQDDTSDGFLGTFEASSNYNCSDMSADAPGANSVNSYEVTFVSETAGFENFHITSANTSIIDVTSDQSGGLFSDDIDYVTRTGSWDIGADEYVATSSATPWLYGRHFFNTGR